MIQWVKSMGMGMMGAIALAMATVAGSSAIADERDPWACSSRQWVDPLFGPRMGKVLERELKKKGYRPLSFRAPRFEQFRTTAAFREPTGSDSAGVIAFYFQVFRAPNFEDVLRLELRTDPESREIELRKLIDQIPTCPNR